MDIGFSQARVRLKHRRDSTIGLQCQNDGSDWDAGAANARLAALAPRHQDDARNSLTAGYGSHRHFYLSSIDKSRHIHDIADERGHSPFRYRYALACNVYSSA
jgi:hypothetical protein